MMLSQISSLKTHFLSALQTNVRLLMSDQDLPCVTTDTFLAPACKVIVNYYDEEPRYKIQGVVYTNTSLSCQELISEMYGIKSPLTPFSQNITKESISKSRKNQWGLGNHAIGYVCIHRPFGWEWADKMRQQTTRLSAKPTVNQEALPLHSIAIEDNLVRELLSKDMVLQMMKEIVEYTYSGVITRGRPYS